jgi:DNA polymerase III subunit epsilon
VTRDLRTTAMLTTLLAAAAALAVAALLLVGAWPAAQRDILVAWAAQRAPLIAMGLLAGLGAAAALAWSMFARRLGFVPHLVHRIELLRSSRPELRVEAGDAVPEPLAQAINGLADDHFALRRRSADQLALATEQIEEERDLLSAVLAEQSAAVIACSQAGRVLMYTPAAAALLERLAPDRYLGLGRTVFALFRRSAIQHGLERLALAQQRGDARPAAAMLLAMRSGALLHARFTPLQGRQLHGFFLQLQPEPAGAVAERSGDARRGLANLRAAVEMLRDYPQMDNAERARFVAVVDEESARLAQQLGDVPDARWPLEDIAAETLLELLRTRLQDLLAEAVDVGTAAELWVSAESFALTALLRDYVQRLGAPSSARWTLELQPQDRHAALVLSWNVQRLLDAQDWAAWEQTPLTGQGLQLSPSAIARGHGGELWQQRSDEGAQLQVLLPRAGLAVRPAPAAPVEMAAVTADAGDGERLAALVYTAFDTETTGLDPSAGDQIIALGGIRIVDGRIRSREVFDSLVATTRRIDPAAQRVHGIDAAMLAGQPPAAEVLRRFRGFCEDTVLLGHNAAFDLRFFELQGRAAGIVIERPLLDTLLLSQLVYPQAESHQLEAIAERLGLSPLGRHTALGDAILTAEVFLRLLPLLAARGIQTLPQALAASRATALAGLRY